MARTINFAKCPNKECSKKFEMGFGNDWMSSIFGQYTNGCMKHECEDCGKTFHIKKTEQTVFKTTVIK